MTSGHFGLAAAAKKWAPNLPLWALFVSTYLLDIIFLLLWVAGIESLTPLDPTHPNAYGSLIIHADYTHSLAGALLIALFAGWFAHRRWGKRGGIGVATVVFSHWLLDLLVHRPDLPILPGNFGNLPLLGFGLWEYPRASAGLELIMVIVGACLYFYSILKSDQRRRAWIAGLVTSVFLFLLFIVDILGL